MRRKRVEVHRGVGVPRHVIHPQIPIRVPKLRRDDTGGGST
jgi:hypothetical protein